MILGNVILTFHLTPQALLSSLEKPNSIFTLFSLGSLDVIKCRASVQALSLKKLPFQLLQELCPLMFSFSLSRSLSPSLSPSHRRRPVELAWRTLVSDTSSPSFSAFGARFPTIPPGDPTRVQGHTWDKMTQSPLLQNRSDPPSSFDLSKVSPLQLRCSDDDSFLLRV